MSVQKSRLLRELDKMNKTPPTGICVTPRDDSLKVLEVNILGPENSPYKNGLFNLEITISDNYPFYPPSIKFSTKIYHPNIDEEGRICMDLIKTPPKGQWRPTIGIEGLLIAIRMLLQNPNPDDPLMPEIAEEFKYNRKEFDRKVEEFVKKYAKSGI